MRRSAEPVAPCDRTITYDGLAEVLPDADWLILCCPASPLTRGLANAAAFAAMPAGAHLINVARGEVAVEADVDRGVGQRPPGRRLSRRLRARAARSGLAALGHANVIVSPHTASHSLGQSEAIFAIFLDNLARWRDRPAAAQ